MKKVVAAMETTGTPYMVTGSYASSLQGEPCLTHDVDLVVAMSPSAVRSLVLEFPDPAYYLDEIAATTAIRNKGVQPYGK